MTAAAKIVVTIIVAMCTGGTGGMFATLGKAAATTIGGTTGVIVGTAINTTLTTLARSMIVNTIENRGHIGRASEATFNKESLKGLGAKLIGQALIGGGPSAQANPSDLANTAQEAAQEAATSWVTDLQDAFADSLKSNMASFVGQGVVYGHWGDQLKEAGINTLTDTAAQFDASQIGAGRKGEIEHDLKAGTTDLYNYLSHKISHAALGAATRAAHAKLSGGNRKEVRKAAKGGAIGAASAEMLAEAMMPSAVQRIQTQLETEGLSPSSAAYGDRRQELLSAELKNLTACGEIAAVITAQAIGGDIEAAQLAARNALTYNSSLVFEEILHSNKPDDLFAAMVEDQLGEETEIEERGRSRERDPRDRASKSQSPPRRADASFEKFNCMVSDTRDALYDGQKRFRNGERTVETFLKAHGADWLDTFGYAVKGADFLTGGAVSQAGKLMGDISEGANTKIRRNVRDLTGNQHFAQEVGDYSMFLMSFFLPGTAAKVTQVINVGKMTSSTARLATRARMVEALDLVKPKGVALTLEFKEGMNMRDFNRKAKALQDLAERGKLFKAPNPVQRNPQVTAAYRARIKKQAAKQWKDSDPQKYQKIKEKIANKQADHMQDLQVRGLDHSSNLCLLDANVNQLLGSQLRQQLRKLPDNTPISNIIIKGRKK
jgi:filamentous hemagglutinin